MKNTSPYDNGYGLKYPDSRMVSAIVGKKLNFKFETVNSLDIGCGIGNTVQFCEDLGFNAFGLDLDESAIKHSILKSRSNLLHHNLKNQLPDTYDKFFHLITDRASLQHNTTFDLENYIFPNMLKIIVPEGVMFSLWAGEEVEQDLITTRFRQFTSFEKVNNSLNKFFVCLDLIKFESISQLNGKLDSEYLYIGSPKLSVLY